MIKLPSFSATYPDYTFSIVLGLRKYKFRMTWNVRSGAWFLSVSDSVGGGVAGIKVVPNLPLLTPWRAQILMDGDLVCQPINGTGDPGYDAFDGAWRLVYMTSLELENWAKDRVPVVLYVAPPPAPPPANQFTDARDGEIYATVEVGGKTWLAENYRYAGNGRDCNGDSANRAVYGRLYNFTEALNNAPAGWHFPTYAEYLALYNTDAYGATFRVVGFGNGTNASGLSLRPGGAFLGSDLWFGSTGFYLTQALGSYSITATDSQMSQPTNVSIYGSVRYIKD